MNIHPIRTDTDYQAALKQASALVDMDPAPGTEDGDRLDVLATLIEVYEARHYPFSAPDPIEAIKFRMEQAGLTAADMAPYIGQRNRVYEILNRKRPLTLAMMRKLHQQLHIPAESLLA